MKSRINAVVFWLLFCACLSAFKGKKDELRPLERSLIGTTWKVIGDTLTKISFEKQLNNNERDFVWADLLMKKKNGVMIATLSMKYREPKDALEHGYMCMYSKDSIEMFLRVMEYDYYYLGRIKQISKTKLEFIGDACEVINANDYKPYRKAKMTFIKQETGDL